MIPPMADVVWTTLITGTTAVLSGGIGWLSARGQTRVELQKLKQERDPGTAENLKFRQDLYLKYIELADGVFRFISDGDDTFDGFMSAYKEFAKVDDEVELFAAASVVPCRKQMWGCLRNKLLDGIQHELFREPPEADKADEQDEPDLLTEPDLPDLPTEPDLPNLPTEPDEADAQSRFDRRFVEVLYDVRGRILDDYFAARTALVQAIREDVGPGV